MVDFGLDSLMFSANEKDLTDAIDLNKTVQRLFTLKKRSFNIDMYVQLFVVKL